VAKEKILVVDDEEDILELVRFNLAREGYQVHGAATGESAVAQSKSVKPDLIILDLMLPGMDGLEVARVLKQNPDTRQIPIVMLTAKGEDADIVAGLELGAEDYITKPFSPRVLVARVRAVLRRGKTASPPGEEIIKIHDLAVNPLRHEVLVKNKPVDLTATEFKILQVLAARPGWVFTRNQIINQVKGDDYPVTDRSVDVQIVGLRKKLGAAGNYIETIHGVGYRFKE
jgi:two-component system, OmpR family, alkaline phosphatase synthesis response regulator PhoP